MLFACLCMLTVSALAIEPSDFEYESEAGVFVINWNRYCYAAAQEKLAESGVILDLNDYVSGSDDSFTFDNLAFEADYATALATMQGSAESEVVENGITDTTIPNQPTNDSASDNKYPLGGYIDEMGRVYSPEGVLLSDGTETVSYLDSIGLVSDETTVGDGLSEPLVYQVVDMRSGVSALSASDDGVDAAESDSPGVLSGLKDLIISIFGEYTPVMTASPVTETVDNVVTTTLIDTVASGVAGMDWPWISGVFLFAVVLWSFFRCVGVLLQK